MNKKMTNAYFRSVISAKLKPSCAKGNRLASGVSDLSYALAVDVVGNGSNKEK